MDSTVYMYALQLTPQAAAASVCSCAARERLPAPRPRRTRRVAGTPPGRVSRPALGSRFRALGPARPRAPAPQPAPPAALRRRAGCRVAFGVKRRKERLPSRAHTRPLIRRRHLPPTPTQTAAVVAPAPAAVAATAAAATAV